MKFRAWRTRIALRIALGMMPVVAVVLTVFSLATVAREAELIELEMQRDVDTVALLVADSLRTQGGDIEKARAYLDSLKEPLERLDIALVEGRPSAQTLSPQRDEEERVIGKAAVALPGLDQWVVVTESLTERDVFVRRALITDVVAMVVATLVACAFAVAVGHWLVQRRVDRLSNWLNAVGQGQYPDAPLGLGDDELGALGDVVSEMTEQLRASRDEAASEAEKRQRSLLLLKRAERLAAVGRTVAVFAHEVGTPLSVIRGRADRLARPNNRDAVTRDARSIIEQTDRIAGFVRRLLDYTRHDDGFELVPVDLEEVVRDAVALVSDRARFREVDIQTELGPVWVEGDFRALQQVVTNLLENAVDASSAGDCVEVTVKRSTRELDGSRGWAEGIVCLVVEDRGTGIPEALRERVLDPFFTTKHRLRSCSTPGVPLSRTGRGSGYRWTRSRGKRGHGSHSARLAPAHGDLPLSLLGGGLLHPGSDHARRCGDLTDGRCGAPGAGAPGHARLVGL